MFTLSLLFSRRLSIKLPVGCFLSVAPAINFATAVIKIFQEIFLYAKIAKNNNKKNNLGNNDRFLYKAVANVFHFLPSEWTAGDAACDMHVRPEDDFKSALSAVRRRVPLRTKLLTRTET